MDVTTLTAEHPLPDGQLTLLGAVETVTGSMARIETGGSRLLIDCGIAQGLRRSAGACLASPVAVALGRASYATYVVLAIIPISLLAHHWIERPLQKLLTR